LIANHSLSAQTIVPGQLLEARYPTFREQTIKQHGISKVTVRMMRKPSSHTIYDDGRRLIYHFDGNGSLKGFQKVIPGDDGLGDTIGATWIRMNGQLRTRAERIGRYRRRLTYEYPSDTLLIETVNVKRGDLDWQELSTEQVRIETKEQAGQRIESHFRGGVNAKPYQRTNYIYEGEKLLREEQWLGARLRYLDTWTYESGLITSFHHRDEEQQKTFEVTYSTASELQDEGTWCENSHCRNWSMVYFDNGLPKGWIIIDPKTQDLEIWEFRYEYF
jgi:hypothetical protein